MIYLIGGPPRCGKTTVTKVLAARLGIPWLSADTLESVVSQTLLGVYGSKEDDRYARLFPKDALRRATDGTNDQLYSAHAPEEIADAYRRQGQAAALAIETMVACELAEEHDYIIEGHQVQPALAQRLSQGEQGSLIRTLFLVKRDPSLIEPGLRANVAANDWAQRKTRSDETYRKIAEMVASYSEWFATEAGRTLQPFLDMDEGGFQAQVGRAVELLAAK